MSTIQVVIGFDQREAVAYHTFCQSILERASQPVSFTPLALNTLNSYVEQHTDGSNAFIYSRFLAPWLMGYQGWAIFADGDMICRDDIAKLWALRDESKAVMVVKHDYKTKAHQKYLGNGLKALFQVESAVNLTGTSGAQGVYAGSTAAGGLGALRDSYIGVNSKYGTVLGGFLSTPYRSTLTSFDVFPGATGDGRIETFMGKQRFGTGTGTSTTYLQADSSVRASALAYAMPTLYGFNGSIAYTGSNNNGMTNQTTANITTGTNAQPMSALSLNLGWEGYGVAVKGAFQQAKVNTTVTFDSLGASSTTPASGYTSYLIGAQYTGLPGLKAGVVYNRNTMGTNAWSAGGYSDGANKGSNNQIWSGVSYRFGNNEPRLSYAHTSNTNWTGGSDQDGGNQWNLGWGYYLSKRTQVYGIASQIKNNANGVWNFASGSSSLAPTGGQKLITYGAGLRTNF